MRERRVRNGNTVVFDAAKEVLDGRVAKGKVLLKMKNGPISYETEEGVKFWNKHPYQWVSPEEAERLTSQTVPEFVKVKKEDAEDYYAY